MSIEIPNNPSCVPIELWQTLHKLPLPVTYFSEVIQSTQTHQGFWKSFNTTVIGISDFPWSLPTNESSQTGLENYVVLKCLSLESLLKLIKELAASLISSVHVPALHDVYEDCVKERSPLLLYHDHTDPVSQINHEALSFVMKEIASSQVFYFFITYLNI